MSQGPIKSIIRAFLEEISEISFEDEDNLFSLGVVDSLQVIELIAFLEEEFTIDIPAEHVNSHNFQSVLAMTKLVEHIKK